MSTLTRKSAWNKCRTAWLIAPFCIRVFLTNDAMSQTMRPVPADVMERAHSEPAEGGGRWHVTFEWAEQLGAFEGIVAPPFVMEEGWIHTPFENWILKRRIFDGEIAPSAICLSRPIGHVIFSEKPRAFAFMSDEDPKAIYLALGDSPIEQTLLGHTKLVSRILFSPDAARLLSCADDETFRLWNTKTGDEVARLPGYGTSPAFNGGIEGAEIGAIGNFAAFSADGRWLATSIGKSVSLRQPSDGKEVSRSNLAFTPIILRFAPDSASVYLFSPNAGIQGQDRRFLQWEIGRDGQSNTIHEYVGEHADQDGLVTSDGRYMITWYNASGEMTLWTPDQHKEVRVLEAASRKVYAVTLSPSGKMLAAIGNDDVGRVEKWRGGLGLAYRLPALSSAGASLAQPCSVSTSRSSNRACGFPAHGSPTGFSRQHTMALSRSGRDPANLAIFAGK